mmetsp:Transcript_61450/g.126914  ORF Transcript_61450/g.126914 Transcript_61450/m.126914 type:complete len:132 (+) Transcript_61450:909-1304(+)
MPLTFTSPCSYSITCSACGVMLTWDPLSRHPFEVGRCRVTAQVMRGRDGGMASVQGSCRTHSCSILPCRCLQLLELLLVGFQPLTTLLHSLLQVPSGSMALSWDGGPFPATRVLAGRLPSPASPPGGPLPI